MFDIKPFTGESVWTRMTELAEITPKEATKIGDIEIAPRSIVMSSMTHEVLDKIHNFKVRDDDVWITTYPKCGTTWMQEMCWLILNNCNFEASQQTDLEIRSPYLEYNAIIPEFPLDTLELLEKMESPRVIKTHLPISLLPKELWTKNPRIIHVCRDPRDAAVSYYHLLSAQGGDFDLSDFLDSYITQHMYGSFWGHTLEFWQLRHNPNVLTLAFEDIKKDLPAVLEVVCSFLKANVTPEQMTQLEENLSFESMRKNKSLNHDLESKHLASLLNAPPPTFKFMRKGQVGSHKTEFPPQYIKIFDEWVHSNLKNSDFVRYR